MTCQIGCRDKKQIFQLYCNQCLAKADIRIRNHSNGIGRNGPSVIHRQARRNGCHSAYLPGFLCKKT